MVEFQLQARRGPFDFAVESRFAAPWTVIFGPSGAGKSTLLRLIAGLEPAERGRIAIRGRYVTDTEIGLQIPAGKRFTGMAAQQPALFPHLSVSANVAYGLRGMSRSAVEQRVAETLALAGAQHLVERSPRALSGGEAQRVSLARALAPLPQLLLLDEPLSALGAQARDGVLTRLQDWLRARSIQTILVTHDAADALATEAEVALLNEGKLVAQGPAEVVLAEERERLIRRLSAGGESFPSP